MSSDLGYFRHPTIHEDTIAFVCEDDLWSVDAKGGVARRLTASPGIVSFPSLSPDGTLLAFTGRDDGPNEVYVMPAEGGTPKRLTWLGSNTLVAGWHPDGTAVLAASDWRQPFKKTMHLLHVPIDGDSRVRFTSDPRGRSPTILKDQESPSGATRATPRAGSDIAEAPPERFGSIDAGKETTRRSSS